MFIYTEEEIREVDRNAGQYGLSVFDLMENAGCAIYEEVKKRVTREQSILILAGKGNNGGDGIVLARYLKRNGFCVDIVFPVGEPESEIARQHYEVFVAEGYSAVDMVDKRYDVVVDALLGIGTKLPLRENVLAWVRRVNKWEAYRIAVDVPTGVLADCGVVDEAFLANVTVSLHGFKPSAFLHPAVDYYGEKLAVDIGIPHDSKWRVWTVEDVKRTYPKRSRNAHKGTFGTGLLVAGSDEMPGSAMLAGIGAMRCGIGKLVIATTPFASGIICGRLPEATFLHNGLERVVRGEWPEKVKAVAMGPGLSGGELIEQAVERVFAVDVPVILDATALGERVYPRREAPVIVTPHPGEFSKMTGIGIVEMGANRLELARGYAIEHGVVVALKGRHTVVAFPDGSGIVNVTGNSGLAKGGTGDMLTGMMLSMVCTHDDVRAAVANAVYLHGKCADYWSEKYAEESFLASDFSLCLPVVLKEVLTH